MPPAGPAGCRDAAPGAKSPAVPPSAAKASAAAPPGVRLVYISPLKALNNDIQRNLRIPLAGVRAAAAAAGLEWPEIRVAVRSGDTPQRERRALLSRPPHILITTPESLYLLLTSPRAREIFAPVRTVIVDEIHTLAGNKRGVHLSVSLERLQNLVARPIQRIGLSATIRPLEEVARFLGGAEWASGVDGDADTGDGAARVRGDPQGGGSPAAILVPRPVTIVDAGHQKPLDLRVETLTEDYRGLPGGSVWPVVIPRVLDLIRQHRTTLVFTNNRRLAERTADRLNEQAAAESRGEASGLIVDGVAKGVGFTAAGTGVTRAELTKARVVSSSPVRVPGSGPPTCLRSAPTTAAWPATRAWRWSATSRPAGPVPWWARRRWSWASTSARSISWCSCNPRPRWRRACSGWAARATWWARPARAASSPPIGRIWCRRPSWRGGCSRVTWKPS